MLILKRINPSKHLKDSLPFFSPTVTKSRSCLQRPRGVVLTSFSFSYMTLFINRSDAFVIRNEHIIIFLKGNPASSSYWYTVFLYWWCVYLWSELYKETMEITIQGVQRKVKSGLGFLHDDLGVPSIALMSVSKFSRNCISWQGKWGF